jgi:nucleoid-associated protein YgaU
MTGNPTPTAARARLAGLVAVLALLALVAGIPTALLYIAGTPVPGGPPSWAEVTDALTRPDDGTLFLKALVVVAWLGWASFTLGVVVDVASRIRGVPAPRLPALRMQQRAAAGLVGAAALLFTAAPITTAATPPVAAAARPWAPSSDSNNTPAPAAGTQDRQQETTPAVRAPVYRVRAGDSLWSIAEQKLGDGARFIEIARLNYDRPQPGGGALDRGHWIAPGWMLRLPPDARHADDDGGYTVEPGDTLSQIALDKLGDPARYPEIYEANTGTNQPNGERLVDPDLIRPGWTLTIPGHHAPDPGDRAARASHPRDDRHRAEPELASEATAPGGPEPEAPDTGGTTAPPPEPPVETAAPPAAVDDPDTATTEQDLADADDRFPVRTVGGVGALLAAGVLGLIAARRGAQQRHRKPGHQVPMPTGAAADIEQELRATADPLSVETVDRALRTLAARCADIGRPLPVVRAGRLTATQMDLYLAEPATLPAPWTGTADATVWALPADAQDLIDAERAAEVPAPYPSLVTIGHDEEDGHVFLDLEYLGALGVVGAPEHTRQVLAAIAVELATSRWADDLQVTIVGAYPELEDGLETGRIRYLPAVGHLFDELATRADGDRAILAATGAGDLNHARVDGAAPGVWTPEIVLLAGEITTAHREKLARLVDQVPRVAVAAVTSGEPVGEWAIRLQDGVSAGVLEPIGLRLRAQLLDDHTYNQVLTILATATDEPPRDDADTQAELTLADLPAVGGKPEATPAEDVVDTRPGAANAASEAPTTAIEQSGVSITPEASGGPPGAAQTAQEGHFPASGKAGGAGDAEKPGPAEKTRAGNDSAGAADVCTPPRPAPRILLLGPVTIENAAGPVEPSKRTRLTELAAFLVLHPGCDHTLIDAAQWPGERVSDNTRNSTMSKLRRWLGKTSGGEAYLPRYQAGARYQLHDQVSTDWHQWQQLLPDGPQAAGSEDLEQALALVRGRPFDGVRDRRYAWAENLKQHMISAIVDASHELARRRLTEGRWRAAEAAVVVGLSVEPGMERLWRTRILAAHAGRNPGAVQEAVDRMLAIADELGGDLENETQQLLTQLRDNKPTRDLTPVL